MTLVLNSLQTLILRASMTVKILHQLCAQVLKYCAVLALSLSLVLTPQMVMAANIILLSGLKHLEMDLGTAMLVVDEIDSNVQLTVTPTGALNVKSFSAKKITLRMKPVLPNQAPIKADKKAMPPGTLPEKIQLPFPIVLESGKVDEIVIIRGLQEDRLEHIQFNLDANTQTISLAMAVVKSPWGTLDTHIGIENQKPFKLIGDIALNQQEVDFNYLVHAELFGSLQKIEFKTRNHLVTQNGKLSLLAGVSEDSSAANITTDGFLSLENAYPLGFKMQIKQLNPALVHGQLAGTINLNLTADGALAPYSQLAIKIDTNDSQIRGQALALNAEVSLIDGVLEKITSNGKLADNTFSVNGTTVNMIGAQSANVKELNQPEISTKNEISWQADFKDISALGTQFGGELHSNGSVISENGASIIQYALSGQKLILPNNITMDAMSAEGMIYTAKNGKLANKIVLSGFSQHDQTATDYKLINANIILSGTQEAHQLVLDVTNTNEADQAIGLKVQIDGGRVNTADFSGWQGAFTKLSSLDNKTITLSKPAPIQFSEAYGFKLDALELNIKEGLFAIDTLVLNQVLPTPLFLSSHGRIEKLALKDLQDYLFLDDTRLKTDLILAGGWNINVANAVNADIQLKRESGDIIIQKPSATSLDGQTTPLGLSALTFNLNVTNSVVDINTEVTGDTLGFMRGNVKTSLSKINQTFGVAPTAPLSMVLDVDLKTLAWLPIPKSEATLDANVDGAIKLSLSANGNASSPNLQGSLNGSQLLVTLPSEGVALNKGEISATFSQQALNISKLKFEGGKGYIEATGRADFSDANTKLNLNLQTHDFTVLSRTDRMLVVAGTSEVALNDNIVNLNGRLKVLRGLFELPKQGMPSLGDDVVVIGNERVQSKPPIAINIGALSVDFGEMPILPYFEADEFMLRGGGLNGALSGAVTLSGNPSEQLRASGSLNIIGTFMAYGQILDIENGQINFSGPLTNAGLNITAMRNIQPTKAGVKIAGTILAPTLKLISSPEVPDADKLSLLVIGQPMSEVGNSELALLSVAAGALLADGESVPLQTRIANTAGLDTLNVTGSDPNSYAVSVGKRISNDLYLGYEKSLFGLLNVAKLTYRLTQRVSVETRAGSESAVDLLYSFNFN
jgi:translocation and assembly module TamB